MKTILVMIVCLGFCAPLLAQNAPTPAPRKAPPAPAASEEEVGARTVKLSFKFEPQNPGDQPSTILCAGGRYGASVTFEAAGNTIQARIGGHLRMLNDKEVFVTFETEFGMRNNDGGGMMGAEGSARLLVGKERKLAIIGDRALVVTATFED
jgi:hypothetical protein